MERHGFHSSWQIGNWPPDGLAAVDRIGVEIVAHIAAYGQLDDTVRVGSDGRLEIDVAGSLAGTTGGTDPDRHPSGARFMFVGA